VYISEQHAEGNIWIKGGRETKYLRKLPKGIEMFCIFYSAQIVMRVMKFGKRRWAGHVSSI
jgi:hypothetical protein